MNLNATILGQTIAFILFVLFCMKYIWPPLISAVDKRQKDIIDSFSSIELAKKDLEIAQAQAANDVIQAKAKAKKIIEQANQRKNEIINESKIEAEIQCKNIILQTQEQIKIEKNKVYKELCTQVSKLALMSAEKIIESSINDEINNNIIDNFITKI